MLGARRWLPAHCLCNCGCPAAGRRLDTRLAHVPARPAVPPGRCTRLRFPMFDALSDRLRTTLGKLTGHGRISEADVDAAMREVRLALLEADVNFKVVKDFVARVRERAVGHEVLDNINAGQQVVKIVNDELTAMLGAGDRTFRLIGQPAVVMLVGLQGSGKTTSAAKLARYIVKQGRRPLLVAADPYRPAAVEQLMALGSSLDIPVYQARRRPTPVPEIVRAGHRPGKADRPRRGHPRHRRPPHGRRDAHGGDPRRRQHLQGQRDAARRRRHGRPGGGDGGRGVP